MSRSAASSSPLGGYAARAVQPARHHFAHLGGESFHVVSEPSDVTVLQGELFGEKERRFLREQLQTESVCFALKDTYKVWLRTLWQHTCLQPGQSDAGGQEAERARRNIPPGAPMLQRTGKELPPGFAHKREGRFVVCLHDMNPESELTTSWVFTKFLRPFFRKGFSVVMVDLPGFGKSTLSMRSNCSPAEWRENQSHLLTMIIEDLGISSCHVVACGESAGILLRAMQRVPHRLEHNHILINPVFDKNEIFYVDLARFRARVGDDLIKPKNWRERRSTEQSIALEDLLRRTSSRIWCMFDRQSRKNETHATYSFIKKASLNAILCQQIACTDLTREDISETQASREISHLRIIVPSRQLKFACGEFLVGTLPPGENFVPAHMYLQEAEVLTMNKTISEGFGDPGKRRSSEIWGGEDLDNDDDKDSAGGSIPGGMMAQAGKTWGASSFRGAVPATDLGRRGLRPPTWGRSAHIAREMLRPRQVASAGSVGSGPEVDWEKAPFEPELSYAVRKELQDTLDESKRQYMREERVRSEREMADAMAQERSSRKRTHAGGRSYDARAHGMRSTGALKSHFM